MTRYLSIALAIFIFISSACAAGVKDADLAGSWYPSSKAELSKLLEEYIDSASPEKIDGRIYAIITPHAGYRFSGPVAAYGFKSARAQKVKTAIIIGFTHRKQFNGISVYDSGSFRTPLGGAEVDALLAYEIIMQNSRMSYIPEAFSQENSVEMMIPFVQVAFKDAKIVPIAFGGRSYEDAQVLASALASVLSGRDDFIIVASTDLSHYHAYEEANSIDRRFVDMLAAGNARQMYDETTLGICEACGIMPVVSAMMACRKMGADSVKILKYANSGDTAGDKSNVVGYLSAALYKNKPIEKEKAMLNESQRKRLLQIARESITNFVRDGKREDFTENDPALNQELGAFVTLHENGSLRGCIGNMVGRGPLYKTVADMAVEAATGDPRFSRLSTREIDKIDLEISVLSPLKKVSGPDEVKIPGHGVIVKSGFASGVYLPQVATETGWSKEEFLSSLCAHKAGLKADAWKDPATEIYVFTAEVFGEKNLKGE